MYPFDFISKRNQRRTPVDAPQLDFLLLSSEPEELLPLSRTPLLRTSRYLGRRRVLRTARRLRSQKGFSNSEN